MVWGCCRCDSFHAGRTEKAKPGARAEVIATGKGLLNRVAIVLAGARTQVRSTSNLRLTDFGERPNSLDQ